MERVDDDGARAREQRGRPSDRARLGRVRVDDVGPDGRMMRASRQAAIASRTGESSRDRPGSCTT